jgi:16S rRNA (cytosine967-C5)-methyltransferase
MNKPPVPAPRGPRTPGLTIVDGPREVAAQALSRVLDDGAWAQPALSAALDGSGFTERDKGLVTELFYGALRFAAPLEASLLRAASKPQKGLDQRMRPHLLIAAYQLQHLSDRIPAHAAVSAAVAAIKRVRPGLDGFANALLRHLGSPLHQMLTPTSNLFDVCTAWGVPMALGRAVTRGLPSSEHQAAIAGLQARPTTWALFFGTPGAQDLVPHPFVPRMWALGGGRVDGQEGFKDGAFVVMDPGSVLSALALAPAPGARVLDLCAAPGGKSMILADAVTDSGHVTAVELQRRRAARIEENAARLGMRKRVEVKVVDVNELGDADRSDAVLLDAPCTGLGTTRRKPEIARRHTDADVAAAAILQTQLFDKAAALTNPGGVLVYSVCSPLPEEGAQQVASFLTRHPAFEREPLSTVLSFMPASAFDEHGQLCLVPHLHDADAFFVARLRHRPSKTM